MEKQHKLLVVDDEPDILYITVRTLQKYFLVDPFTSPIKALAHFEKHANEYTLVLSDIRMPGMSGMEFLNVVKLIRPDIPILVMTAYSASDDEIVGAIPWIAKEEIVHKPFRALEICGAVKKILKITSS
ncbi:putative signal transduction response regulator, receiver domain protein [Candidatus Nitrososphaera gargensis Ga9.2]|uniref:Putative signal transduction response regulator, receiver domain protein n=1 Tax=Nitrososphaera gargensis (strain Ga9.2) TaxID=1237085 RepID=K0INQ7_NITGG|nr:response regulator [Candidatus Nitrososphaera gargensis]AFU59794.1 putative signal transduction response regulator, receiver domain protein [Candidatus Nitrososphaera gargensis Ga9.2]